MAGQVTPPAGSYWEPTQPPGSQQPQAPQAEDYGWNQFAAQIPSDIPDDARSALADKFFNEHVAPKVLAAGYGLETVRKQFQAATQRADKSSFPRLGVVGSTALASMAAPFAGGQPKLQRSMEGYAGEQAQEAARQGVDPSMYQFAGGMIGQLPFWATGMGGVEGLGLTGSLARAARVAAGGVIQGSYDILRTGNAIEGLKGAASGAGMVAGFEAIGGLRQWLKGTGVEDSAAKAIEQVAKGTATETEWTEAQEAILKNPRIDQHIQDWAEKQVSAAKAAGVPDSITPGPVSMKGLKISMVGGDQKTYTFTSPADATKMIQRVNEHLNAGGALKDVQGPPDAVSNFYRLLAGQSPEKFELETPVKDVNGQPSNVTMPLGSAVDTLDKPMRWGDFNERISAKMAAQGVKAATDLTGARNSYYHATDMEGFKGILDAGEIRPYGTGLDLDTFGDTEQEAQFIAEYANTLGMTKEQFEEHGDLSQAAQAYIHQYGVGDDTGGVSVSRVPRVASKESKGITFVIDADRMPRSRPFAEPGFGKTVSNSWTADNEIAKFRVWNPDKQEYEFRSPEAEAAFNVWKAQYQPDTVRNPHFEFEQRTYNEPIPLSAVKGILVDRSALGSQSWPSFFLDAPAELQAEYKELHSFGQGHEAYKIYNDWTQDPARVKQTADQRIAKIQKWAAEKGLQVKVFDSGREMHSYRAGLAKQPEGMKWQIPLYDQLEIHPDGKVYNKVTGETFDHMQDVADDITSQAHEESPEMVRGSANVPLTEKGRQEMDWLGQRVAAKGGVDTVSFNYLTRSRESASAILAHNPMASVFDPDAPSDSWRRGDLEGAPHTEEVSKYFNQLARYYPDHQSAGMSEHSTRPGESFNEFKTRWLPYLKQRMDSWDGTSKEWIQTHFSPIKATAAWLKAGAPDNFDLDIDEFLREQTQPGSVYRLYRTEEGKVATRLSSPEFTESRPKKSYTSDYTDSEGRPYVSEPVERAWISPSGKSYTWYDPFVEHESNYPGGEGSGKSALKEGWIRVNSDSVQASSPKQANLSTALEQAASYARRAGLKSVTLDIGWEEMPQRTAQISLEDLKANGYTTQGVKFVAVRPGKYAINRRDFVQKTLAGLAGAASEKAPAALEGAMQAAADMGSKEAITLLNHVINAFGESSNEAFNFKVKEILPGGKYMLVKEPINGLTVLRDAKAIFQDMRAQDAEDPISGLTEMLDSVGQRKVPPELLKHIHSELVNTPLTYLKQDLDKFIYDERGDVDNLVKGLKTVAPDLEKLIFSEDSKVFDFHGSADFERFQQIKNATFKDLKKSPALLEESKAQVEKFYERERAKTEAADRAYNERIAREQQQQIQTQRAGSVTPGMELQRTPLGLGEEGAGGVMERYGMDLGGGWKLRKVNMENDQPLQPGIYLARHGETAWNKGAAEPETVDIGNARYKQTPLYHRLTGDIPEEIMPQGAYGVSIGAGEGQKPTIALSGERLASSSFQENKELIRHERYHAFYSNLGMSEWLNERYSRDGMVYDIFKGAFPAEAKQLYAGRDIPEEVFNYTLSAISAGNEELLQKFAEADTDMEHLLDWSTKIAKDLLDKAAEKPADSLHKRALESQLNHALRRATGQLEDMNRTYATSPLKLDIDRNMYTVREGNSNTYFPDRESALSHMESKYSEPLQAPELVPLHLLPDGIPHYATKVSAPSSTNPPVASVSTPPETSPKPLRAGTFAFSYFFRPFSDWLGDVAEKFNRHDLYGAFANIEDAGVKMRNALRPQFQILKDTLGHYDVSRQTDFLKWMQADDAHKPFIEQELHMKPEELEHLKTFQEQFMGGLGPGHSLMDFIQRDLPRLQQNGYNINTVFPKDKTESTMGKLVQSGRLDPRNTNLAGIAALYAQATMHAVHLSPLLDAAEDLVNGGKSDLHWKIKGYANSPLGNLTPLLNRQISAYRGIPDFTASAMHSAIQMATDSINNGIESVNKNLPSHMQIPSIEASPQEVLNDYVTFSYAGALALKPAVLVRDALQLMITTLPILGSYTFKGMKRAFEVAREGSKSDAWLEAQKYGAFIERRDLQSFLGGGEEEANALESIAEKALKATQTTHNSNRLVAFWGHQMKITDALEDWSRTGDVKAFTKDSDAWFMNPGMRKKYLKELETLQPEGYDDYSKRMSADLVGTTQWNYRPGQTPGLYRYQLGRLFGQYGTWPLNYIEYARRYLQGSDRGAAVQALTRLAIAHGAVLSAGQSVGIDTSKWVFMNPAGWEGGPLLQTTLGAPSLLSTDKEGADERQQLKELLIWPGFVPGGDEIHEIHKAITDKSPNVWIHALGFKPVN